MTPKHKDLFITQDTQLHSVRTGLLPEVVVQLIFVAGVQKPGLYVTPQRGLAVHHHVGGCQEACQLLQQHEGPVTRLHHCVKVGQYEAQALVSQFTLACHLRRESGGSCLDSTKLWHLSHMSVI